MWCLCLVSYFVCYVGRKIFRFIGKTIEHTDLFLPALVSCRWRMNTDVKAKVARAPWMFWLGIEVSFPGWLILLRRYGSVACYAELR